MSFAWTFKEAGPGDRARESQVEKFFNSDAVTNRANAIIREGIQNSLDAAPGGTAVRVRITTGEWSVADADSRLGTFTAGFFEHFNAEAVRSKIIGAPQSAEPFRYLVFEDFGTSGLQGDPAQWWPDEHQPANPFFNYFRAEGISDKSEGSRGRHGVGRLVFMFASRTRCIFGLTRRSVLGASEELLMGTTVLRNHRFQHKPYLPDGWFGVRDNNDSRLVLPIRDPAFIAEFKRHFSVSRDSENGLSVIVPYLNEDVTEAEIVKAVLAGYFYPILRKQLVVEVESSGSGIRTISDATIDEIVNTQSDETKAVLQPLVLLAYESLTSPERITLNPLVGNGAPKWEATNISESDQLRIHNCLEAGDLVAIRVPMQIREKGKSPAEACFDVFIQRDAGLAEAQIQFIREGIIISDARPRRTSGIRALVVINEGPLATFLGDAENPSHTEWQAGLVRDRYSFHAATINYVVQCVPSILSIVSQQQKKPDTSLLIDLFSLPTDDPTQPKSKQKKPQAKPGGKSEPPVIAIPPKPRRYKLDKHADGFLVRRGDLQAGRPSELTLKVAYGVRRGNPFTRYNRADFLLGRGGIDFDFDGCTLLGTRDNEIQVRIDRDDFRIAVTGFDTAHRDLEVDVKVKMEPDAEELERADATAF